MDALQPGAVLLDRVAPRADATAAPFETAGFQAVQTVALEAQVGGPEDVKVAFLERDLGQAITKALK